MVNVDKLKGRIVEKRHTVETLAKEIGIDKSTMYRKLNENGESFSIGEAAKIAKALELSGEEAKNIFFADVVA